MLSRIIKNSPLTFLKSLRLLSTAPSKPPITVTDSCIRRIRQLKELNPQKPILRVYVDSGGCSGFQYEFEMASHAQKTDQSFTFQDIEVAVDVVSIDYLEGATVNYEEEMMRSSFAIVANPKADLSCSCGTSFSLKQ